MVSVSKKVLKLPKTDQATSSAYTDSDYGYFEICNLFSELRTEYQKLVARQNLGIKDTGTSGGISEVNWPDIKGNPKENQSLKNWIDSIIATLERYNTDTNARIDGIKAVEEIIGKGLPGEFLTITSGDEYGWEPLSMQGTEEGQVLVTHVDPNTQTISSSWEQMTIGEDLKVFVPEGQTMGSGKYINGVTITKDTTIKEILKNLLTNIKGVASAVAAKGSLPNKVTKVLPLYKNASVASGTVALTLTSGSYTGDGYLPATAPKVTWTGSLKYTTTLAQYNPPFKEFAGDNEIVCAGTITGATGTTTKSVAVANKAVLASDALTSVYKDNNNADVKQSEGIYTVTAEAEYSGELDPDTQAKDSDGNVLADYVFPIENKQNPNQLEKDVIEVHCVYPIISSAKFLTTPPTTYNSGPYPKTIYNTFDGNPYEVTSDKCFALDYLAGNKTVYLQFYNKATVYIPFTASPGGGTTPKNLHVKRLNDTVAEQFDSIDTWITNPELQFTNDDAKVAYYVFTIYKDAGVGNTIVEISWE